MWWDMSSRHRTPPFAAPRNLVALGLSLGLCFAVYLAGGLLTGSSVKTWYPTLVKPALTPPPIAFPIAWSLLFLAMALAAWRVWRAVGWQRSRGAMALYALQLVLNIGWSWVFFGQQQIGWALAEIGLLWLAIAACILAFARHDRVAALLLVPYLLWVSFAAYLNLSLWQLNPA